MAKASGREICQQIANIWFRKGMDVNLRPFTGNNLVGIAARPEGFIDISSRMLSKYRCPLEVRKMAILSVPSPSHPPEYSCYYYQRIRSITHTSHVSILIPLCNSLTGASGKFRMMERLRWLISKRKRPLGVKGIIQI